METIVERPAALDVHKAQVTACVRVPGRGGGRAQHLSEFATTVTGLLTLRDWLAAHGVSQVAMEGTGVYWKPVWTCWRTSSSSCWSTPATSRRCRGARPTSRDAAWLASWPRRPAAGELRAARPSGRCRT